MSTGIADVLARAIVAECYGAYIDEKLVDHNLKLLGWKSGLSEDTYYEMNPTPEDDDE